MLGTIFKVAVVAVIALFVMSEPAHAGRLLETQGKYIESTGNAWVLAAKAILFLMGLGAIGFAGWNLMMDYVFAKADHEKKFSIGKLIVGMVVGSVLCVPYSAVLVGSDITGATEATATESEFQGGGGEG